MQMLFQFAPIKRRVKSGVHDSQGAVGRGDFNNGGRGRNQRPGRPVTGQNTPSVMAGGNVHGDAIVRVLFSSVSTARRN
jgi:hypothetical protein